MGADGVSVPLRSTPPALLAIDGGGSKIDAALVSPAGEVLGAARCLVDGKLALAPAITAACVDAGIDPDARPVASLGVFCLTGADLPADEERIVRDLVDDGWTAETVLRNDTFAVLRAGSERNWGVAVVCGTGINCTAVAPDGRTVRFPALGQLSGDWGGGYDIGSTALWHAVRAEDGRGPATSLTAVVPAHFGLSLPHEVVEAFHFRRIERIRLVELPPVVFLAAAQGDEIAASIVERQADEVVTMVVTAVRRLGLDGVGGSGGSDDLDVVLGGGIFRNGHDGFFARMEQGIRAVAADAAVRVVSDPPVVGAVLLGLDRLGAGAEAGDRARATLTHDRLTADGARG
jgi:N-acetylglucosamine kinase-like BadF-type ATPase